MISPIISDLVQKIPLHEEEIKSNNRLIQSGIMNTNLCLDAQTIVPHTERYTSYTIISVPNQNTSRSSYKKNQTSFEFYIDNDKVIVIPMSK